MQKTKKTKQNQGAVNCIKCLSKVTMETEKYSWEEKIEEMLLKFARAVIRAWKATLHAGHTGVGGAI